MYSWLYINIFKCSVGRNHTNVMSVQLDLLETLTNIIEPTVHNWEKPYQCDVCLARFIKESERKIHSRTHSGEKPYQCGVCSAFGKGHF